MQLTDYIKYDGLGLAELIRNKEIKAEEAIQCAKQAIEQLNPKINSIIEVFPDPLSANTDPKAPFHGVPFILKDLALHAKGVLNEVGSRLAQGIKAEHDTELMTRFREAGLQTIARASTPEFGFCATTEPLVNGPTRNPWDLERMAGGSSGATAAVVAAGIVPLAHANDGGGSIRIPAACCGLVGLKPSRGRVTAGPDVGEALSGLAVELAVTRTVRDTAAILDAVHGNSLGDPYIIAPPAQSYLQAINTEPKKLRIAYSAESWAGAGTDAEVKNATEETARLCEQLGHEVIQAAPEFSWEMFFDATVVYWTANICALVTLIANIAGREINQSTLEATTLACYEHGKKLKATDLLHADAISNQIRRSFATFFQEYDLLLTPSTASPPLPVGSLNANDASMDAVAWSEHLFNFTPFTPLFNMTGQPAISLPLAQTKSGLPLGMHFAARFGDETTLLQLARQFEQAKPWPHIAPLINH